MQGAESDTGSSDRDANKMNVVILGSGRTGTTLAANLAGSGHYVSIIDLDADNAASLVHVEDSGHLRIIEGDGTSEAVLESARIRDADLFVALTGSDTVNGLAALKAKITYRVVTVIAIIWSGDLSSVFESQGIACVNPARLTTDTVIANIPQVLQSQAGSTSGD